MGAARELPPIAQVFTGSNARRGGRVRLQSVASSMGEVQDVSASGVRIRRKGKPPQIGSVFGLMLEGLDGPIEVSAKVVWVRRTGFMTHEMGLEFASLGARERAALTVLARTAPMNETLRNAREIRRTA